MRDINCKQCGEPYSEYSLIHEVSEWENEPDNAHERFMNGEGCPTCDWGEKAGDVSHSRFESESETEVRHIKSAIRNSDQDPLKFF